MIGRLVLSTCVAIFLAAIALFVPLEFATARTPLPACNLPLDLQRVIENKYSGTKIVTVEDLNREDKELFQKEHEGSCPGLVKVDFYGDGKPTFALSLTTGVDTARTTKLVLAHQLGTTWRVVMLDKADGPAPVIWSEQPGKYEDVYGEKSIVATSPVIVFCGYSSWAVVYAWTKNKVSKVWLQD